MESREEAENAIVRFDERSDEGDGYGFWAVERKADGVVAGTLLLVPLKRRRARRGRDRLALPPGLLGRRDWRPSRRRPCADYGWALGLPEIHAVVFAGNDASMAVCRRLGMEHLGSTTQFYDIELEHFRVRA